MAKARKTRAAKKPPPDLVRRRLAIDATMRRFGGKLLAGGTIGGRKLKLGKTDCAHLFRSHLVAMGHRGLPKIPAYSSPAGARAALGKVLRGLGGDDQGDLRDLADALLPAIAPAAMLPGDIAFTEADPGVPAWRAGALVIFLSSGKVLGWHPDSATLAVIDLTVSNPFKGAWRC